jgi:iron(III) transport system permease protein
MLPRGAAAARAAAVVAVAALVGVLVVLPLLRLVQVMWQETGGHPLRAVASAELAAAVRHTVVLAVAVPAAAVPIGVAVALVLRRPDLPGRAFWRVAVLLPVVVPDFVLGYSWTQAYARAGFTDATLGVHWAGLLGPVGVWAVLVVNAVPLVYLVVAVGLAARAEPDAERAARVSGASGPTALLTVTLRLLLPSVAAAAVLVFVLTLGTFAIPQVLGAPAGFRTVTTQIYANLSIGGDPANFLEAITLAVLLVLVTALCVAPADALLAPRLRATRSADAQAARPVPGRPAMRRLQAGALAAYLAVTTALPLAALALS